MGVSRAAVLDALAAHSDPSPTQTTTVAAIAAALDADCHAVRACVRHLVDCGLARREGEDGVRVTRPGAAVAAMDVEGVVVVDVESEE
jgi:DNA-binding IclR family transcriptional regulator